MINHAKNICKFFFKSTVLFLLYGIIYFVIECLWKHQLSDYRMLVLGGLMGVSIGLLNSLFSWETSFILQCLVGSLLVTLLEAILGTYWNEMGIYIWDYSSLPLSYVHGNVNLFFSTCWFLLSGACIIIDDWLRYKFFNERKPKLNEYRLF